MSQPPRRLHLAGVLTRSIGTLTVLVVLATGQALDSNDLFPFGTLSQYATARDMNGTIRSVYLTADTSEAEEVPVPLSQFEVGVGRAEIEGQLARIIDNPSLLQSLADAHSAMYPDRPELRELQLMRSTRQLQDGYVVGEPELEKLVTWTVRNADAS